MKNLFEKAKIRVGVDNYNKFSLNSSHMTTADFMNLAPIYIKEMVPGESINLNLNTFVRTAPLFKPTIGKVDIEMRAFFVPMRTIMDNWNQFITLTVSVDEDGTSSVPTLVSTVSATTIMSLYTNNNYSTTTTGTVYDFEYFPSGQSTSVKRIFTKAGRALYKMLLSLGYKFDMVNAYNSGNDVEFSALPLLAFAKLYMDWYCNPQYTNPAQLDWYFKKGRSLGLNDLVNLFSWLNLGTTYYKKDYFTSAWDNPVAPSNVTSSLATGIYVSDTTQPNVGEADRSRVVAPNFGSGTPFVSGGDGNDKPVLRYTDYMIHALERLTDFIKRNQLSGSRAMDRYFAHFGKKLTDEQLKRSIHLGKCGFDMQISDVMLTAPSDAGGVLGDYAGKSIGYGNGHFSYKTDEFGYIVITQVIRPLAEYYQGWDRNNLHVTATQFFNPEFDQMGVQAIAKGEVLGDVNHSLTGFSTAGWQKQIFGYVPRYAEYKIKGSAITGDFALGSRNVGMNNWYLNRDVTKQAVGAQGHVYLTAGSNFAKGMDSEQYDKIFQHQNGTHDGFIIANTFDAVCNMPMSSLYDNYEWDEGGHTTEIAQGGTMLS